MKSGIYYIKNLLNGKMYIGSSKNCAKRFKQHKQKLLKNSHDNIYLQRAYNKYGSENFEYGIIELTESLFNREEHHIKHVPKDLLYNIGSIGGGDNLTNHPNRQDIINRITIASKETYKNSSEEYKELNRSRNRGENNPHYGKTHTTEVKKDISTKIKKAYKENPDLGERLSVIATNRWNTLSTEDRLKFGKHRKEIMLTNNPFKGMKHTTETKKLLSDKRYNELNSMTVEEKFNKNPQSRKVEICGKVYFGLNEAGRQLGISPALLVYRLKSNSLKWIDYQYVD